MNCCGHDHDHNYKHTNHRRIRVKVEVGVDVYDVVDDKGNIIKTKISRLYKPDYYAVSQTIMEVSK